MNKTLLPLSSSLHEFVLSNHLYVDKSAQLLSFINFLINEPRLHAPNIFMVIRPRGFGLTLAAEAIEAILMEDELISSDLNAEHLAQAVKPLPVVRLSMKKISLDSAADFRSHLLQLMQIQLWEHHINKSPLSYHSPKTYFAELLKAVSESRNSPVAVIIDNYDVPFLTSCGLPDKERDETISLYLDTLNAIKQAGAAAAFCLLTGHIKFELSSLYAEGLPAVRDISSHSSCDTLFGFTPAEVKQAYQSELQRYAPRSGITAAELMEALEKCYGGFVFSDRQIKLLCPASVNAAFENEGKLLPYQAQGDYTFLKQMLTRYDPDFTWLFDKDGQDALFLESFSLEPERRD